MVIFFFWTDLPASGLMAAHGRLPAAPESPGLDRCGVLTPHSVADVLDIQSSDGSTSKARLIAHRLIAAS